MSTIELKTLIRAPQARCFDLARSLDLHVKSMSRSGEEAIAPGRTTGLIELGEEVTWRARHFGVRQRFTSKITAFERPLHFQDTMQRGAFKSFVHDHWFEDDAGRTLMSDVLVFVAPLGLLGRIVDKLVLARYLTRLLSERNDVIKEFAEGEAWREVLAERKRI